MRTIEKSGATNEALDSSPLQKGGLKAAFFLWFDSFSANSIHVHK